MRPNEARRDRRRHVVVVADDADAAHVALPEQVGELAHLAWHTVHHLAKNSSTAPWWWTQGARSVPCAPTRGSTGKVRAWRRTPTRLLGGGFLRAWAEEREDARDDEAPRGSLPRRA